MRRLASVSVTAIAALYMLAAGLVPAARADHVPTAAEVSGVLKQSGAYWNIRVRWNIICTGGVRYSYNVDLIREDTGGAIFVAAEGYGFEKSGSVLTESYPATNLPAGTRVHTRIIARCYDQFGHPTQEARTNGPTIVIPEHVKDGDEGGGKGGGGSGGGGAAAEGAAAEAGEVAAEAEKATRTHRRCPPGARWCLTARAPRRPLRAPWVTIGSLALAATIESLASPARTAWSAASGTTA